MGITPENTLFIILSFEGPDVYSLAGGLGARITHLTRTLAGMGFLIHHFFIGDPEKEGVEVRENGKKEARLMVKEAEILGNRAIEKARSQVQKIRSEIVDLRNQRDLFVAKFQALTQAQLDFLEQLRFTDADVVEEPMEDTACPMHWA